MSSAEAILDDLFSTLEKKQIDTLEEDCEVSDTEAESGDTEDARGSTPVLEESEGEVKESGSRKKKKKKHKKHKKKKKHKRSRDRDEDGRDCYNDTRKEKLYDPRDDNDEEEEFDGYLDRRKLYDPRNYDDDPDRHFGFGYHREDRTRNRGSSSHDYRKESRRSKEELRSDYLKQHIRERSPIRERRQRRSPGYGTKNSSVRDRHSNERSSRKSSERKKSSKDRSTSHVQNRNKSEERHNRRSNRDSGTKSRERPSSRRTAQKRSPNRPPRRRSPSQTRVRNEETRPPTRKDEDTFWESKWEAMELQKKAEFKESRGKHFLEDVEKKDEEVAQSKNQKNKDKSKDRKEKSPTPETEEFKRLRELKEIQELVVKDDQKYVKEPVDPKQFEWDEKARMWRRKAQLDESNIAHAEKSGVEAEEERLRNKSFEQEFEGRTDDSKDIKSKRKEDGEINSDDERDKEKPTSKKRKKNDKEEGEVGSEEENRIERKRNKAKEKNMSKTRSRSKSRSRRRSRERSRKGRSRSRSERRRYSPRRQDDYYEHRRKSSRGSSWKSRRSRSRSRSRSNERRSSFRAPREAIDKERLLAIARKNAVKLLSSDNLRGMDENRLLAIKSGGQSLEQLTQFCRELARKGITDEFEDDEMGPRDSENEDDRDYHHPFMVQDRPLPIPFPGGSLAPSGVNLEIMTPAMKSAAKTHRMLEFPVSSGNSHRVKEQDVPDDEDLAQLSIENAPRLAITDESKPTDAVSQEKTQSEHKEKESEEEKTLNEADLVKCQNPLGMIMFGGKVEKPIFALEKEAPREANEKAATPVAPVVAQQENSNDSSSNQSASVFTSTDEPQMEIGEIVSKRLGAMRKLSENPNDPEALREMYQVQKAMSAWAQSKNKPGQFTGTTGAKILSKGELLQGMQAWARQDQFTKAKKVSGGFGEFMLKKMGWREGEGLGKNRTGDIDPLTLDIKHDKKGLMASEEFMRKKKGGDVLTLTACKDLQNKHPVSALLEYATKRHWGPPNFVQAFDCGPPHRKQYVFKVTVNGVEYMPSVASENKKKAKADAATKALRELGLLPDDPNNPL